MTHAAGLALQNAAGREVDGAGDDPGRHDRRQQQHHRGSEQHDKVDAACPDRFVRGFVRDKRIGGQRQQLVEQEQGEQVLGKSDADGRAERHRKADIVGGLPRLAVAAHVADRIDRGDDPEEEATSANRSPSGSTLKASARPGTTSMWSASGRPPARIGPVRPSTARNRPSAVSSVTVSRRLGSRWKTGINAAPANGMASAARIRCSGAGSAITGALRSGPRPPCWRSRR